MCALQNSLSCTVAIKHDWTGQIVLMYLYIAILVHSVHKLGTTSFQ